jgi:hypothetical protein
MITITFYHGRNIFKGKEFASWVSRLFPSAKFCGFEYGSYYPKLQIDFLEFEQNKQAIPPSAAKNITKISGEFSLLEQLVYGVRNFENNL